MGGYYTAVAGNTITAANWNTYVRDQTVNVFATYSALTSAVTAPLEGMVVYLTDTDTFWFYKNSNWRLVPGQLRYSKRDVGTTFLSNQAAGSFATAFTSASITVPSSGTGQAFEIDWTIPASSGVFSSGRYNSQLSIAINGGAYNTFAKSNPVVVNATDTYLMHGSETWKAGNSDTSVTLRITVIAVGGNFDSIADADNPMLLRMRTTGLLSSEVV